MADEDKEPCASCVWTAKLFPFVFAAWAGNEYRTLPRGHPNRKYTAIVGALMLGTGIWFHTMYEFERREEAAEIANKS